MIKCILPLALLLLLVPGCNKPEPPPLEESLQRLTAGSFKDWRLEKVVYLLSDVTDQVPPCQKDEIYRFYADGRGEILSGNTPCEENETEVQNRGTWGFEEEGTRMVAQWKDKSWNATVDELLENKLVVTGEILDNYVVTATFRPL